jgi:branched-chain amino acid transport system substrate-binding protein
VFATSGLAESSFADPHAGGIPSSLDRRVLITAAAGDPVAAGPQATAFGHAYAAAHGADPEPVAVDGYEATNLMLSAIDRATGGGRIQAQRVKVVSALFSTRDRHGAIGTYSIRSDGNTTLDRYGVYRIARGRLRLWRSVTG